MNDIFQGRDWARTSGQPWGWIGRIMQRYGGIELGGRVREKTWLAINAVRDGLFLSSLVVGRLESRWLAWCFSHSWVLQVKPACRMYLQWSQGNNKYNCKCDTYVEFCNFSTTQLQTLWMTELWVATSVKPTHNPGRCQSISDITSVAAPSSMTSGSSLLPTAGKSLYYALDSRASLWTESLKELWWYCSLPIS